MSSDYHEFAEYSALSTQNSELRTQHSELNSSEVRNAQLLHFGGAYANNIYSDGSWGCCCESIRCNGN